MRISKEFKQYVYLIVTFFIFLLCVTTFLSVNGCSTIRNIGKSPYGELAISTAITVAVHSVIDRQWDKDQAVKKIISFADEVKKLSKSDTSSIHQLNYKISSFVPWDRIHEDSHPLITTAIIMISNHIKQQIDQGNVDETVSLQINRLMSYVIYAAETYIDKTEEEPKP